MIGWIIGHNIFFFLFWHEKHKKQLDSNIYQGKDFVQLLVSCNLQQHKDAKSLE